MWVSGFVVVFPATLMQQQEHWRQASWASSAVSGVIITTTMGKVTLAVSTAAAITPATEIGD